MPDVVAAYRSQSDAEFGFRQLKDPHVVSFSPMHHWTDSKIRVHVFYCVLALAVAHLMRRHADHAGLHLSVRELLDHLAGIEETVLLYHDGGKGRPRAQRMLTDMTPTQQRWPTCSTSTNTHPPADRTTRGSWVIHPPIRRSSPVYQAETQLNDQLKPENSR